ncbi:MAG TPA: hypothetical protein VGV69_01130 [Solirubrobacterales bacterium]|nr:hypothetical protein [Solirubrobacterales bacterium]
MTERFTTRGEAAVGRHLEKEKRQGTEHYKRGQHHAELAGPPEGGMEIASCSYCSGLGVVMFSMVRVDGGKWELALPKCRIVGLSVDYGIRDFPPGAVPPAMEEVLAKLEDGQ